MLNWIRDRFRDASTSVSEAVEASRDALVAVWRTIYRTQGLIRAGWSYFGPALVHFADETVDLAHNTYRAIRGLVTQVMPAAISHASRLVRQWAAERIASAIALARSLVRVLRDWVGQQLARLFTTLANLRTYARHWIGYLRDRANRFWDKAADLVLHPEKLAAWLLPKLLGPLLAFLRSQGVAIGRWLLHESVRAALGMAGFLERIIVRIL